MTIPENNPSAPPVRVAFMGTPAFVVPTLEALAAAPDVALAAVYTPPDRPRGRGRRPDMPPVKAFALERGLDVRQPDSLRSPQAQLELESLAPDVIIVAAYGKILPRRVLDIPRRGCLNLHPSLLPKGRGPSPVPSAILAGETVTGVSLMLLDEGMDTGPVIAQVEYTLSGRETAETLTADLFHLGADLLMENLAPWVAGRLEARPQNEAEATITRKLERGDGLADWRLPATELAARQRAYTPWPGLFSHWDGKTLKLLDTAPIPGEAPPAAAPGTVCVPTGGDTPLAVATGRGLLGLKRAQLEGRRAVTGAEFLRGHPGIVGAVLE